MPKSFTFPSLHDPIAVLGLGYVGLPLLIEILMVSRGRRVVGFDTSASKIWYLMNSKSLIEYGYRDAIMSYAGSNQLKLSSDPQSIASCFIYVVAVPTPVNKSNAPDLECLNEATRIIFASNGLKAVPNDKIIIYESTVYPGATRDVFESVAKGYQQLQHNFRIGYSPERINPGDTQHRLTNIVKVTSGQNSETADWIDNFYKLICKAGTYKASSIEVAEACKSFENTQRDLNIALVNELALICSRLNINTNDVLKAASTKWNFMPFKPGLVGGHCIGVDPYYLAYKARQLGIDPKLILAGRSVNDGMAGWISRKAVKMMVSVFHTKVNLNCLIMGVTYKEDCEDTRNSKSLEVAEGLKSYGIQVTLTDPIFDQPRFALTFREWNCLTLSEALDKTYNCIIISVAHSVYVKVATKKYIKSLKTNGFIYDLKDVINDYCPEVVKL